LTVAPLLSASCGVPVTVTFSLKLTWIETVSPAL
jgi:hypothetical protein